MATDVPPRRKWRAKMASEEAHFRCVVTPEKKCTKCGKPQSEGAVFYKRSDNPNKLQAQCTECVRKSYVEWSKRNPDKYRAANAKSSWEFYGTEQGLVTRARTSARVQGVPFNLKPGDVTVPDFCPVLGIKLVRSRRKRTDPRPDNQPTLDRVVPALGYVAGNVKVISLRANRLKQDATLEELEALVAYVRRETKRP